MAARCRLGKGECDGCGYCDPDPAMNDIYGDPIFPGESYYEIDGDIISTDNIETYLDQFKVMAND